MAIVVGTFQAILGDSAHQSTLPGKYLVVIKKGTDGKWRMHFGHSSFDAPMPAPPPPARR